MEKEVELFENFIRNYDMNNSKIKHKYDHTLRVVEYAKELAKYIDLDKKEYNRALVCALFHDLGRFPQITMYDTYIDKDSFDHGDKSYEILNELGYDDDIVKIAVKYHNKKVVPKFDELTNMHCKIVRDADKLDIMTIFGNKEIDNNSNITNEILECFSKHIQLDNDMGDTDLIYTLRNLAFVFDINYKRTIEILIDNDLINKKLKIIKENIDNEQYNFIEKEIKQYIKERFDIKC